MDGFGGIGSRPKDGAYFPPRGSERMDTQKIVGMPAADYFARPEVSRSYLCAVLKGGGDTQKWLDDRHVLFAGNNATTLGSNFDTLVMGVCEGRSYSDIVQVPPAAVLASNGSRRGKPYEEWKARLPANVIDVNAEDAWKLGQMLSHLLDNPAAKRLVDETTETQVSVFFQCNGHACKVRPDGCTPGYWWDLKSTSSTWDRLYRSVFDYGYAEQEWLYVQAAMALGMDEFRMPFCFVQTMPPFACHVFYLPQDLVKEAGLRMLRVLEEVRLRRETGVYQPADAGEITELHIPKWALKQEEEFIVI